VRVVIELKRDATPEVVLNQLWRHTPAQTSFPANMLAIRGGRPETLTLRDIIEAFVVPRGGHHPPIEVRAAKARERAHILLGLVVAVTNLDEVVRIIRGSASPGVARARCSRANGRSARSPLHQAGRGGRSEIGDTLRTCSEVQVRAILDLRLHRLTALGRDEIGAELQAGQPRSPNCSRFSATA
jgi:DNA gyrase subunit A